jgi:hypothetical protein
MEEMEMMANGFDFTGTISMSVSGDASFGWGVIMIVLLVVALFRLLFGGDYSAKQICQVGVH